MLVFPFSFFIIISNSLKLKRKKKKYFYGNQHSAFRYKVKRMSSFSKVSVIHTLPVIRIIHLGEISLGFFCIHVRFSRLYTIPADPPFVFNTDRVNIHHIFQIFWLPTMRLIRKYSNNFVFFRVREGRKINGYLTNIPYLKSLFINKNGKEWLQLCHFCICLGTYFLVCLNCYYQFSLHFY